MFTRLRLEVGAQQLVTEQWSRDQELRMAQPAGKRREELSQWRVQDARVQRRDELSRSEHIDPLERIHTLNPMQKSQSWKYFNVWKIVMISGEIAVGCDDELME